MWKPVGYPSHIKKGIYTYTHKEKRGKQSPFLPMQHYQPGFRETQCRSATYKDKVQYETCQGREMTNSLNQCTDLTTLLDLSTNPEMQKKLTTFDNESYIRAISPSLKSLNRRVQHRNNQIKWRSDFLNEHIKTEVGLMNKSFQVESLYQSQIKDSVNDPVRANTA